jgi:hypothetical protein
MKERQKNCFIKVRRFIFICIRIYEQTIAFKGRHKSKQYNKQKPRKWGFKNFALCDSIAGFLLMYGELLILFLGRY